jgi:ABC-2 type transport system ATP-binding protein
VSAIEAKNLRKTFGDIQAVQDVSFSVSEGEIFGLLGPNGAGKTTSIRVILDLFKPEAGSVSVLGGQMNEAKKEMIGYMPEDRGLYQDLPLLRCLTYLGSLKGLSASEARQRAEGLLVRFDLDEHKTKKVGELSKGMQQKAQIINTILHRPKLIIIDEPFTALDPLNTQIVKELMLELRDEGATILMSTHQMHQVEELCDRIVLINKGRDVLYGDLHEIRKRFSGHAVIVRAEQLPKLQGIAQTIEVNHDTKLILEEEASPQDVLNELTSSQTIVEKFEIAVPSLAEIFIRVVSEGQR